MEIKKAYVLGLFIFLLIFALIISFIFICYFVECSRVTIVPLIISYIFLFLFIFLNFIVNLDFVLNLIRMDEDFGDLREGNEYILDILAYFYDYFNLVTKIVRFLIFPFLINYYETGYYSFGKKIFEYYLRFLKGKLEIFKNKCYLALVIIGVILAIAGVVLYFMVREKYGLDSPFSYFNYVIILLNVASFVEIYINVGFFMTQVFKDYKRQGNPQLINLYYAYSNEIIYKKMHECIDELFKSRNELVETVDKFKGQNLPGYCEFLEKLYESTKDNAENHKLENLVINKIHLERRNDNPNNNVYPPDSVEVVDIKNDEVVYNTKDGIKGEVNKEKKEDLKKLAKTIKAESEKTLSEPIRKLKDSIRKLRRLEAKSNDIIEERVEDLNKTLCHRLWILIKYAILFLAFLMVLGSDFLIPIIVYSYTIEDNNTTNITNTTNTTGTNTTGKDYFSVSYYVKEAIALIFVCIFNSAYTIILIYSINRRHYLSGDYLYGKRKNDNISLMKTIKEVTGFSFALIYCNMYFWPYSFKDEDSKMIFFNEIEMPDYEIKYGISIFMIAKLALLLFSIMVFSCCESLFGFFKSDLFNFNKSLKQYNE